MSLILWGSLAYVCLSFIVGPILGRIIGEHMRDGRP